MRFIEDNIEEGTNISRGFVLEIHKKIVHKLKREGDKTPGKFRIANVDITNSKHQPPESF